MSLYLRDSRPVLNLGRVVPNLTLFSSSIYVLSSCNARIDARSSVGKYGHISNSIFVRYLQTSSRT
jgi:hypothetical protein